MHLAPLDSAREKRRSHMLNARRRIKAVPFSALRASLIRRALAWAFPTTYRTEGLYSLSTGLLSCSVGSLRHWLHGRREMPERVRLILIDTIRNRLEQGQAILAELEAVKPKPGRHRNNISHVMAKRAGEAKAADDAAKQAL